MTDTTQKGAAGGDESYSVSVGELRQFVERIERLEVEKKDIADQIREVFAELKGRGYDVPATKEIIRLRRQPADKVAEHEAVVGLYRQALEGS